MFMQRSLKNCYYDDDDYDCDYDDDYDYDLMMMIVIENQSGFKI